MKKVIVLSVVLFASVIAMNAQPRAIGGRFTWGGELSYQHGFGEKNMLQLDLGLAGFYGLQLTGTYDWVFPISSWKHEGTWNWYVGPGAGVGFYGWGGHNYFFAGIAGMIGVEYNFKIPLQLSLDYRPLIGLGFGKNHDAGLHYPGFYGIALGIRYKF
jgi:hypothetical protein